MQVKNLRPDQVLAADVRDRSGRLLIPSGMSIKEKHIKVLMSWGITEVTVRNDPDAQTEAPSTPEPTSPVDLPPGIQARLADLFRHADLSQPHMRELYALAGIRMMNATAEMA
ncbi:MAG: hypothetical protein RBT51_00105 [Ectothiorhodospiraceae bacterium]|nr:hypothetical protein [Ectothiorhodospiraceae bacterium]